MRINKEGKISFDSKDKGKLAVSRSAGIVDITDTPVHVMTSLSINDFHSDEAKGRVANNVKQRYWASMEKERKDKLRERAINPVSIVNEYNSNAVKAEENLVGKYFVLKDLTLNNIYPVDSWKYGAYYKYAISVEYDDGTLFPGTLTLYTNNSAFVNLSYPVSKISVEGRLTSIGSHLVFTEATLLDL